MADICKCIDAECPKARDCYRFRAISSEFRQAWFGGDRNEAGECAYFWPVKEGHRVLPFDLGAETLAEEGMAA